MVKWPAVKWSNFCYKLGPKKYSVCTPGDGDSWLSPAATPGPALLPRRGRDPHPSWWGSLLAECVIWQQPGDPRGTLTESLMESGSKMAETYMQVSCAKQSISWTRTIRDLTLRFLHCKLLPGYVFFKTNIPICLTDVQRALKTFKAVITQVISWVVKFDMVKPETLARYLPYSESLKFLKGAEVSLEIDSGN